MLLCANEFYHLFPFEFLTIFIYFLFVQSSLLTQSVVDGVLGQHECDSYKYVFSWNYIFTPEFCLRRKGFMGFATHCDMTLLQGIYVHTEEATAKSPEATETKVLHGAAWSTTCNIKMMFVFFCIFLWACFGGNVRYHTTHDSETSLQFWCLECLNENKASTTLLTWMVGLP